MKRLLTLIVSLAGGVVVMMFCAAPSGGPPPGGGGTTYTGTSPIVVTGSNITFNDTNIVHTNTAAYKTLSLYAYGSNHDTSDADTIITSPNNGQRIDVCDMAAGDTDLQWNVTMPNNWDGGVLKVLYEYTLSETATSESAAFISCGRAYAANDLYDAAWGNTVLTQFTPSSTVGQRNVTNEGTLTLAGSPSGGQSFVLKAWRGVTEGYDTFTQRIRLIAVKIRYTINAYSD